MTQLLVSVRSLDEALDAFEAGADLIDLKEPSAGSLGRVTDAVALEVSARLREWVPLSMALGELLADLPAAGTTQADPFALPDAISFAKLGLAGCAAINRWPSRWEAAVRRLPATCAPVAVIYADWEVTFSPAPETVLEWATRLGCRALLIDTYEKKGATVFEYLPLNRLAQLIASARSRQLLSVLAGSLTLDTARQALHLAPDFVAVRGAVCDGPRHARLVPEKVRQWKALCRSGFPAR